MRRRALTILAIAYISSATLAAKDDTKSGPQAGSPLPGPFFALNVKSFLKMDYIGFDESGTKPGVVIFTRKISDPLIRLVKKVDSRIAEGKNKKATAEKTNALVILLSDEDEAIGRLQALAAKQTIENVILAVMPADGPKKYNLANEAEVTVIFYSKFKVKSNHAFKKGELNDTAIHRIVTGFPEVIAK